MGLFEVFLVFESFFLLFFHFLSFFFDAVVAEEDLVLGVVVLFFFLHLDLLFQLAQVLPDDLFEVLLLLLVLPELFADCFGFFPFVLVVLLSQVAGDLAGLWTWIEVFS